MEVEVDEADDLLATLESLLRSRQPVEEILAVNLADDVLAWELRPDGWRKVRTKDGVRTHDRLQVLAEARALGS